MDGKKFFVEPANDGIEKPIIDKLTENKCKIVFEKDFADYIIKCVMNPGVTRASGYIMVIDKTNGEMVAKSPEETGQRAIWNGYANPSMLAMKKIAKKHILEILKKLETT